MVAAGCEIGGGVGLLVVGELLAGTVGADGGSWAIAGCVETATGAGGVETAAGVVGWLSGGTAVDAG
ncbi:hypothetical protein ASC89_13295 [Devosia sp. Root413D1]|nr:hypothetical protein ASC89_13295 [Devosia sp. Root413D1]